VTELATPCGEDDAANRTRVLVVPCGCSVWTGGATRSGARTGTSGDRALITVAWVLCDCPPALAARTPGAPAEHMAVFCNVKRAAGWCGTARGTGRGERGDCPARRSYRWASFRAAVPAEAEAKPGVAGLPVGVVPTAACAGRVSERGTEGERPDTPRVDVFKPGMHVRPVIARTNVLVPVRPCRPVAGPAYGDL
jgi:hypothetical protein